MGYDDDEPEITVDFAAADEMVPLAPEIQNNVDPMNSGFLWYKPPATTTRSTVGSRRSTTIESTAGHTWVISGHDMQILTSTVPAGETIVTEVGTFMYGSSGIKTEVELTCFSKGGCTEGWNRICGGESCVKVLLTNEDAQEGFVGLTPNFPAKIIPIKFGKHISAGSALITPGGTYMSHLGDVDVSCDLDCGIMKLCPLGCCRQKITGTTDSTVFMAAGGTIIYRLLKTGETIIVDSRSVVAIESSVELGLASNGRCCTCCLGGEGCFSTTLTGPGKIFMQSMNFQKFQDAVQTTIIDDRGSSGGGGGSGGVQ